MPSISQFAQISDYALVEYIYESEAISTTQARCLRLENKYTNTYQFLNNAQAYGRTKNVLDRSASRLGVDAKTWAYQDIDSPIPIIVKDSNFFLSFFLLMNQISLLLWWITFTLLLVFSSFFILFFFYLLPYLWLLPITHLAKAPFVQ